ncbi:amidase [Primorskyibacter aestuariivivens]|uniref:amidase n=1 Tax=Primorskyibacter aestuariivivens TaxID=1888912 RepID=UPI002301F2FF|nr:amidase [Primorskyibacter aestuariivivens]MDA7429771.1 amidase [Primorskyibacter aestuariivivens]
MDILNTNALDLSRAIATRELSAEELMRATLARIGSVNPSVNAIVSLRDEETLLAEARAADAAEPRGWMHGLPLAVKDLANAAGLPTSMGSPALAGTVAKRDDIMVARMRAAGAIVIGKTNTPEFGLGSHSYNPVFGVTRNPWDLTRSAGGSSGGAGAALAARMVSIADGSDMMGSLRNPAAWNNVYGFRPTWGRIPSEPEGDAFLHSLSTLGPMARCPRDLAALLDTQSGPDPNQPFACSAPPTLPGLEDAPGPMRIGWLGDWGGAYAMEPCLRTASATAVHHFEALGCDAETLDPPFSAAALWNSWITLRSWAVAAKLEPLYRTRPEMLKPEAIWEIERGLGLSAMEVHRASAIRSDWFRKTVALFERFDALVLPATQLWPFPAEWDWPKEIDGTTMDSYHRWMEVVIPVSLIGLPCLALPAGFGDAGLPHGLQVFGPKGSDGRLLQIGQLWHGAQDWTARVPAVPREGPGKGPQG